MCDGLSANNLTEDAIVANCMDQARCKCYYLRTSYKDEVNYILAEMQQVYLVDREAKELLAIERLAMHLKQSNRPWIVFINGCRINSPNERLNQIPRSEKPSIIRSKGGRS